VVLDEELRRESGTLLAAMLGIMSSCTVLANASLGVFVVPLTLEFGWSRQQVLTASSFVLGGALFITFIVGWLTDRVNVGRFIIGSQLGFGLTFCALALIGNSLWTFYTIYLLMAVLAGGTLPVTFTKIVAVRFIRHRGLATGVTLSGTGLAALVVPPYAGYFVNEYGWRIGFLAVAAFPICVAMPAAYAFLRRPLPKPRIASSDRTTIYGMTLAAALRSWRFWVIIIAFLLASGAAAGMALNLVPLLIERGYAPQKAANMAAVYGLAVISGRILVGSLADRFWVPPLAFAFLTPAAIATYFIAAKSFSVAGILVLIGIIGLGSGAEGDLLSYLVPRYFGLRAYGAIFASIFVAYIAGVAIAAPLFGYAYDTSKTYLGAMTMAAIAWQISAFLLLSLGRYPKWSELSA
jgi:MFS transporter, OFA family, oxalate/formate antiporter